MNGDPEKIEILAPFSAAYEWMKAMLFRPFDAAKWFTIAFAAFIAGPWSGGLNFRWNQWARGDWNYRLTRHGDLSDWTVPAWLKAAGLTYHSNPVRWANDKELHVASRGQEFVSNIGDQTAPREWLRTIQTAIETD